MTPFWKFGTKGDRFWWVREQKTGAKFKVLFGMTQTTEMPGYEGAVIYKIYLGPLVIGWGIQREVKNGETV